MLIAGAGGHAIELIDLLLKNGYDQEIILMDEVNTHPENKVLEKYKVLSTLKDVQRHFIIDNCFALGIGKPQLRKSLCEKLESLGGNLVSIISNSSSIGSIAVNLGDALNILQNSVITERVQIGKGTLIHIHTSIHHDVEIGEYCELSPGARILGKAKIGSLVSIGANATILPGIIVGDSAVVGAGAVVTKDVEPNTIVAGVPAKPIKR